MRQPTEVAGCYILHDVNAIDNLASEQFTADYWQDKPGFFRIDGGRGGSVKICIDGKSAVLRQYLRGGFVARWLRDQYLWLGKSSTRAWREWKLLREASELGIPVSKPLGVCVWRSGLIYRAALMTAFLENTETLAERLTHSSFKREAWYQLGLLLRQFQGHRFRHADLNANNLLIDRDNEFYIIDLDKARIMPRLGDWQWGPLYRLQRSLDKIDRMQQLHYQSDDWQALMDGYQSSL